MTSRPPAGHPPPGPDGSRPGGPAGRLGALDGLRGLSVAAVLAFHAGANWATGGSIGVDVFFVLSGYLITWLLLAERARTGHIRLRAFYARRVLRLVPALVALLVAVALYALLAAHPVATQGLLAGMIGSITYVSDIQAATGHVPVFGLVEHTWSLSIEEHFYLVWPVLMLLVARRFPPPVLAAVAGVLAVGSALLPPLLWHGPSSVPRLYYAPDTRAQQLLIGCLLAVGIFHAGPALRARAGQVATVLAPLSLLGLVAFVGFSSYRHAFTYHGGLTLVALLAAVPIAAVVLRPDSRFAAALSVRPLAALGTISYGLYLWHWPIFLALNQSTLGLPWLSTQLIRVAVALAVSIASYALVEKPFLRLQRRFRPDRRPVGPPPVVAAPTV